MSDKTMSKECLKCKVSKPMSRGFYASYSPIHADRRQPICKQCLWGMIDLDNIETVKDTLRQIDRPFLQGVWNASREEAVDSNSSQSVFGKYIKNIAMNKMRHLTWADSELGEVKNNNRTSEKEPLSVTMNGVNLSKDEIQDLEDKYGYGFDPEVLVLFERKYKSLVGNYPTRTSLHEEALRTYCVYKVRAELETAKGNVSTAKEWANLAQKQGDIAKININKLTKSDLSQGLDGFSQLARMVEQAVDIIPILPQFIEKPKDKIDFAIWCFVNYERRLHGLPEVEYSDVYDFYQKSLKEHMEKNPEIAKIATEVEIDYDGEGTKKKLLTIDIDKIVKDLQDEHPDDNFIQNLHKWVDFISWARWKKTCAKSNKIKKIKIRCDYCGRYAQ